MASDGPSVKLASQAIAAYSGWQLEVQPESDGALDIRALDGSSEVEVKRLTSRAYRAASGALRKRATVVRSTRLARMWTVHLPAPYLGQAFGPPDVGAVSKSIEEHLIACEADGVVCSWISPSVPIPESMHALGRLLGRGSATSSEVRPGAPGGYRIAVGSDVHLVPQGADEVVLAVNAFLASDSSEAQRLLRQVARSSAPRVHACLVLTREVVEASTFIRAFDSQELPTVAPALPPGCTDIWLIHEVVGPGGERHVPGWHYGAGLGWTAHYCCLHDDSDQ